MSSRARCPIPKAISAVASIRRNESGYTQTHDAPHLQVKHTTLIIRRVKQQRYESEQRSDTSNLDGTLKPICREEDNIVCL
jgi:hypothetical protein